MVKLEFVGVPMSQLLSVVTVLLLNIGVVSKVKFAQGKLLWDGDANIGLSVFGDVQALAGTIDVKEDPQGKYGKVFAFDCHDMVNEKSRCEVSRMNNLTLANHGEYYVGWRSLWGPLPTREGKWQVLSQIHYNAHQGPVPFGLAVPGDGKMHFNAEDPNTGNTTAMWTQDLPLGSWHSYVMHINMSTSVADGWVEIWYDGVMQTLANNQTRIPAAMANELYNGSYFKWECTTLVRAGLSLLILSITCGVLAVERSTQTSLRINMSSI